MLSHNLNVTVSCSLKYVTRPGTKSQKQTDFIDIEKPPQKQHIIRGGGKQPLFLSTQLKTVTERHMLPLHQ